MRYARLYDSNGDEYGPEDVLDAQELTDYCESNGIDWRNRPARPWTVPGAPQPAHLMSDDEICRERILDLSAEERAYDREHMSDRDADYEADRYENRTERFTA